MNTVYDLAIRVSFEAGAVSSGVAGIIGHLARLNSQAGMTATAMAKVEKSMAFLAGGAIITGIGLVGVSAMKSWVSAAGELQNAMTGVQLATVGTHSQLNKLGDMTFGVAAKTRFSAPDIANMMKLAATAGLNNRSDLINSIPTIANAAEIAQQLKGVSYESSVPAFVSMAHLFQAYGGKKFTNLIDLAGRASVVSGDTPETMARTLSYLMPSVNAYGLSPEDAISVAALASNVGLAGGRGGGSRIQAMFRAIAPLMSSRGNLHNSAIGDIEKLGGGDFFTKSGQFGGVTNLLEVVMRAMTKLPPAQRMSLLTAAFGSAGSTALSSLTTQGAVNRFASIQGLLAPGGIASTGTMQGELNKTWVGQLATFKTDLHSISTELGQQLLPVLTPILSGIVKITGALVEFGQQHKGITQFVATFTLVATAAALVVGPVLMVAGAVGLLSLALVPLGIELLPVIAVIAGIVAVVTVATLVITHWGDITKWLGGVWGGFYNDILKPSLAFYGDLLGPIGSVIQAFLKWSDAGRLVGMTVNWLTGKMHDFLVFLGILQNGPPHATNAGLTPAEARAQAAASQQPTTADGGTVPLAPNNSGVHLHHARSYFTGPPHATHHTVQHTHTVHVGHARIPVHPRQQAAAIKEIAAAVATELVSKASFDQTFQASDPYSTMLLGQGGL